MNKTLPSNASTPSGLRSSRLAWPLMLAAVLASACQKAESSPGDPCVTSDGGTSCAKNPAVDPTRARPDTPAFGVRGPLAVGYRQIDAPGGEGAKPLKVKVWYPAGNPARTTEAIDYKVVLKRAEWQIQGPAVIHGRAIADAPIDDAKGPYPLVVFSHGYSINPEWYSSLLEHYASWGFVVLAPEHTESDWLLAAAASFDRPLDIKRTVDSAEKLTAPGGGLAGAIDMKNVAVVGHSYGGYTALAVGGARFDLAPFNARCAALPPDDPKAFFCAPFAGKEKDMASRAGLGSAPTGLWPTLADPRVTAIVPMMGDAYLFGEQGFASVTVPMMAIGGTGDDATPWEWGSKPSYDRAASGQKSLVAFEGANHFIATNPCESMPWIGQIPPFERDMICFDQVWDKARAMDLIRHFSTAFLLKTSKNDPAAHAALVSNGAQFRGIGYSTTLK